MLTILADLSSHRPICLDAPCAHGTARCSVLRAAFPECVREKNGESLGSYALLPPLEINGTMVSVAQGTGAIRTYEAIVYGVERNEPAIREKWKRLLLHYSKLDSLSVYHVWEHWRGRAEQVDGR